MPDLSNGFLWDLIVGFPIVAGVVSAVVISWWNDTRR